MPPSRSETVARELPRFFNRYQGQIDRALRAEIEGRGLGIYTTLRYYLGWSDTDGNPRLQPAGKALRPTLCLLACEASGGDPERALPAAVAVEYIHNFSLIHDDVEDRDLTRHHRETVWAVWGVPIAIVSGNTIFGLADLAVQNLTEQGTPSDVAIEVGNALATRYLNMMEGQYLDISFESRSTVTVDEYLDMIWHKTGALIECSMYTGAAIAVAGSKNSDPINGMRALGRELGSIFQIRDDVLGIWGGPETGKPVGADIHRRKKALPAVHALNHATGPTSRELAAIYTNEDMTGREVERVMEMMDDLGTRTYCERLAESHWQKAQDVIKSLPLTDGAANDFRELGEYLLVRER